MGETKHTPTPWRIEKPYHDGASEWQVMAPCPDYPKNRDDDLCIAECAAGLEGEWGDSRANAAFIVKAVNSHDALVSFVRDVLLNAFSGGDTDGGWAQDEAERLGLIVKVPFDPAVHRDEHGVGVEPGDDWFTFAPALSASTDKMPGDPE